MTCIKTGFCAYLEPYDKWIIGDAFQVDGAYIFRICDVSDVCRRTHVHYTIRDWFRWFDENETSMAHNSTMVCKEFGHVTSHGYAGWPLKDFNDPNVFREVVPAQRRTSARE